ncbi:hypothetical protein JADG_004288 [Aureobasidium aubasidani]|nr:hypothetical protein JADG_004288 [Aureobasidium pullulans]
MNQGTRHLTGALNLAFPSSQIASKADFDKPKLVIPERVYKAFLIEISPISVLKFINDHVSHFARVDHHTMFVA